MHAARAVHKQREKREEKTKLDVRRPSAISQSSRHHRSPAVSVDTSARKSQAHSDESDNLNFSYIGFIIAVFGAVPLIVGTFVEVPALWEIGLGVTLVGLFIGVVFWCTELCAEAKKFSQKKNQLSTRGKIEDSNLLQIPERKFGNGMDSRRGSFQSDSVSLISPAVQHYTPNHNPNLPHVPGNRHSISLHSSDNSTTSSARANGHLVPPAPALILRGNGRKDDGRVVSLVQPDPGLDDDSDSDAETVIEAPTSHNTKIIQVQTCQEKEQHKPLLNAAFNIENEKLSSFSQHHRTIRMPVMPQELDKLQKCECGRYLLTERDKLVGIRLPGIGGSSSGSTTTSNSPTPGVSLPIPGIGNTPAPRNKNAANGNLGLNFEDVPRDVNTDVETPLADRLPPPPPNKIINVNSSVKIAPLIPPTPQNAGKHVATDSIENFVQVEPTLGSSTTTDFLTVVSSMKKTEKLNDDDDDFIDGDDDGDVTPGNESGKAFQETDVVDDEERDRLLTGLLEFTDVNDEELGTNDLKMEATTLLASNTAELQNDENHNEENGQQDGGPHLSREGSRRRLQYQSKVSSINRPSSLALPIAVQTSESAHTQEFDTEGQMHSDEATVQHTTEWVETNSNKEIQDQGPLSITSSDRTKETSSDLTKDMSLDELLDSIEKNQEGEILAVVVQ